MRALSTDFKAIARQPDQVIAEIHRRDFETELQPDGSRVTEADRTVNKLIVAALAEFAPEIDIVSEEGGRDLPGSDGRRF